MPKDHQKLPFDQVLEKVQRMSGAHPKSVPLEFEKAQLRFFYEIPDLPQYAESLRGMADELAESPKP